MSALLTVTVDGREVQVAHGTMVMEAATRLGIYVPHFCYHKKLSIAANCRMCLVEVEKAPKPLPACATPVTDGMKVWTHSAPAKDAQAGVMELLLINHPLDCPICDQGGECQLQDLSVGYGGSASRYAEPKRVVLHKSLGPLVAAEEMSRCIQCTRCIRFGQEIAGVMELGMINRGEHAEIVSFVDKTVDSELSGNMIDICPVGALTSKPFRYTARTWELGRRKSVSPHDGLGANLVVQVKSDKVMRVVPLENEGLNECWLSDKDRFSYEGLNCEDRLLRPMMKAAGRWQEVEWQVALEFVAKRLSEIRTEHGAQAIGALGSPHSTLEELYLLQKLVRGLGCENIDFRLRQWDFSPDGKRAGAPWLGTNVAELGSLDRVLIVGSFLRKDHPLIANRFRQAAKAGQQINLIHVADDDPLIRLANKAVVNPRDLAATLAQVVRAAAEAKQRPAPAELAGVQVLEQARAMASSLASGKNAGIFLGNAAQQHPRGAQLHALAQELAVLLGAKFGFLGEAANSVGGHVANCLPGRAGAALNARSMLESPRKAYVLLNVEPELDCANPRSSMQAMHAAEFVVALSPYRTRAVDYADVLLPIAPFTETSGSFINTEGRMQSFHAVVRPLSETRPAWKVLRVLGNLLLLGGFEYETSEAVRDEACRPEAVAPRLDNRIEGVPLQPSGPGATLDASGLQRISDVPIYFADPLARRAHSLQKTADARPPKAWMNSALMQKLALQAGQKVRIRQDGGEAQVELGLDKLLPAGCVRLAAAHLSTADLGAMFGEITVERL